VKKVIIFGLGSIGRRHAKILSDDFRCVLFAYRSGKRPGRNDLGIEEVRDWVEVERLKPEVALITNPTALHIRTAIRCALLGMHLFIEKPLSHELKDIDMLESICRRKKLTCYTAYCLRFHPVIKKIRELIKDKDIYHARVICSSYLPDWRPGQDFRKSYSASRNKGGGVLLDLSHELDYIEFLFGEINKIEGICGRASALTRDSEDFADMVLALNSGVRANLHLDIFSRVDERTIKVDFNGGYIKGDLIKGTVDYISHGKKRIFKSKPNRDKYLKEQIKYFFDNIGKKKIMNGLQESRRLLAKILEFKNG